MLAPFTLLGGLMAPVLAIGPVWGAVIGVRLWRRAPGVIAQLRRTDAVFLIIDAVMIWYGAWMLRAAEASAKRGGGCSAAWASSRSALAAASRCSP